MATRTEHRFIQRELVRSTVIFFVVLAGMLFVLGFSIYRQVSDNLFESIDAKLRINMRTNFRFMASAIERPKKEIGRAHV